MKTHIWMVLSVYVRKADTYHSALFQELPLFLHQQCSIDTPPLEEPKKAEKHPNAQSDRSPHVCEEAAMLHAELEKKNS